MCIWIKLCLRPEVLVSLLTTFLFVVLAVIVFFYLHLAIFVKDKT